MASQFADKKKLLYSDLFKGSMASSPSTESVFGSNGNSSSSCLSSSFGSELGSSETSGSEDEDEYSLPELTRQMAELMLQEDEDNSFRNCFSDEFNLKNQATVRKHGQVSCGRRVRGSESTQQKQFYQSEQRGNWGNGHYYGSGMRAVFLGGSGGSCGTGVFLPRGSSIPAEHKKRSGVCPTVLIPTRVLQMLELHFSRSTTSKESANHYSLQNSKDLHGNEFSRIDKEVKFIENLSVTNKNENEELQLPQEWIY